MISNSDILKKIGEEYIYTFCWAETQFDEEEIKELMGEQYENYFDEESWFSPLAWEFRGRRWGTG